MKGGKLVLATVASHRPEGYFEELGQSTAMAMGPAPQRAVSSQNSASDIDCVDMANAPASEQAPCKKMTMQCMVAMGYAPVALAEPVEPTTPALPMAGMKPAIKLAVPLCGRSYGPEPDPPSFLI